MFITKSTTIEDLKTIKYSETIELSKEASLDKNLLEYLLANFPESKIVIRSGYDLLDFYHSDRQLYTNEETLILADNAKFAEEKYGKTLIFDEGFSVEQAIISSNKIDEVVNQIKSLNLSPFERFVFAYNYVTNHFYKRSDKSDPASVSRALVSVLSGDKIVCTGFSGMLAEILNRVDVPCTTNTITMYSNKEKTYKGHSVCLVRIVDPKYNLNNIYISDPTNDSLFHEKKEYVSDITRDDSRYRFALIQYNELEKLYKTLFKINFKNSIFKSKKVLIDNLKNLSDAHKHMLDAPPILSRLFPEITKGRTQDQMIKSFSNEQISNKNIPAQIQNFIEALNSKDFSNLDEDFLYKTILKHNLTISSKLPIKELSNIPNEELVNKHLNLVEFYLNKGYSKKLIFSIFDGFFSEEKIRTWFINKHKYDKQDPKLQDYVKQIRNKLSFLNDIFDKLEKEHPEKYNEGFYFNNAVSNLSEMFIGKIFYNKQCGFDFFYYLSQFKDDGYSLNEIKNKLFEKLNSFDISNVFINMNEEFKHYAKYNENELFEQIQRINKTITYIYNEPYIDDFNNLTANAPQVTLDYYFASIKNIFISMGYDEAQATELALNSIKKTNIRSTTTEKLSKGKNFDPETCVFKF